MTLGSGVVMPPSDALLALLDQLSTAVYIKDKQGRYCFINTAGLVLLQRADSNVAGISDLELFPPEIARKLQQDDQQVLQDGLTLTQEENVVFPGQTQVHHFWSVKQPLRDADGNICGLLGMSIDIHVLKHKEQQITALKNQYSATLKALPDLLFEADSDGRYLSYHSPSESLLALPPDLFVGRTMGEALPADIAAIGYAALQEAAEKGYSGGQQICLDLPDGRRWFELSVSRKDMGPDTKPHFIFLSRDINDRKMAQLALQEKESMLRAIIDNTPIEFWARDMEGRCILENNALVQHWGSLLGTRPDDSDIRPEDLALWKANNARAYAGETVDNEVVYQISGKRRVCQNVVAPIRVNDRIIGIVGFNQDITERKEAEEQIRNLAFYDPLTELPNRRLMFDPAPSPHCRSLRDGVSKARCHRSISGNFKQLNDTMGHDAGDQLLQEVARRLRASIRQMDTAARLGGDEFVVILEDLDVGETGVMQAERIALTLQSRLKEPYPLQLASSGRSFTHHCSSSIGIATFENTAMTAEEILRRADTAMYQAKAAGRNCVRFFDPPDAGGGGSTRIIGNRPAQCCRKTAVHPAFPAPGGWRGALPGCRSPDPLAASRRGLVPPGISFPSPTGLILDLGHWVLQTVCEQLARWSRHPATAETTHNHQCQRPTVSSAGIFFRNWHRRWKVPVPRPSV
ncbi:MAG: diguanylate cyclase [Gammaproteobacteria bacterium]